MAARKKSTSDVVHDEEGRVDLREQPVVATLNTERFGDPTEPAASIGDAFPPSREAMAAELRGLITGEPVAASAVESMRFDGRITKLQLHSRAHILGIQGTSDSVVVGDVIESIEPGMLGPIPGFVVRLKRGAPVFMPQASVLAVTVAS